MDVYEVLSYSPNPENKLLKYEIRLSFDSNPRR